MQAGATGAAAAAVLTALNGDSGWGWSPRPATAVGVTAAVGAAEVAASRTHWTVAGGLVGLAAAAGVAAALGRRRKWGGGRGWALGEGGVWVVLTAGGVGGGWARDRWAVRDPGGGDVSPWWHRG